MARPKGTTKVRKPLFKKEYERLINATHKSLSIRASTRVKLANAFILLYFTGCRISEISKLKKEDIEQIILTNEHSLSNDSKTGKPRLISFDSNRVQADALKKMQFLDDGYLFAKNNSQKPMTVSSLTTQINTFMKRVLGELYSTHSFRGGYITIAHKQGFSLEHIREDIGHKNISTTARYVTVTSEDIADGKNKREW
jgi:site-specific recombinase XerD